MIGPLGTRRLKADTRSAVPMRESPLSHHGLRFANSACGRGVRGGSKYSEGNTDPHVASAGSRPRIGAAARHPRLDRIAWPLAALSLPQREAPPLWETPHAVTPPHRPCCQKPASARSMPSASERLLIGEGVFVLRKGRTLETNDSPGRAPERSRGEPEPRRRRASSHPSNRRVEARAAGARTGAQRSPQRWPTREAQCRCESPPFRTTDFASRTRPAAEVSVVDLSIPRGTLPHTSLPLARGLGSAP
jgi:hypothetical protein